MKGKTRAVCDSRGSQDVRRGSSQRGLRRGRRGGCVCTLLWCIMNDLWLMSWLFSHLPSVSLSLLPSMFISPPFFYSLVTLCLLLHLPFSQSSFHLVFLLLLFLNSYISAAISQVEFPIKTLSLHSILLCFPSIIKCTVKPNLPVIHVMSSMAYVTWYPAACLPAACFNRSSMCVLFGDYILPLSSDKTVQFLHPPSRRSTGPSIGQAVAHINMIFFFFFNGLKKPNLL